MPRIGPHRFTTTTADANDLHIVYRWSGGTLRNPRVVDGPPPASITATDNHVDVVWKDPLPAGTTVTLTVESRFAFTRPDSHVFTRDGQPLGDPIPYPEDQDRPHEPFTVVAHRAPLVSSSVIELEVINRRFERARFDRARLVGSLVLGNRTAAEARTAVDTLEPLLRAVGRTPISTTALRAAVGEVILNPERPDGTAIRDALVGGDAGECACPLGPPLLVDGEDELVVRAGLFLQQVERIELKPGQRLPEKLLTLYDEGVALHAAAVEIALAGRHVCLHPMTGVPVMPMPPPGLEELIRREQQLGFVPTALLHAFLAADGPTDWEALADEVLFKVLGVFGLIDFYGPIMELLHGADFADVWRELLEALAKKGLKKAIWILIKKFLLSDKFRELLIKKLGKEAAEEILKKIAEKWIPILGWAVLIGNILAVIISQIIYYAFIIFGPLIL